MGGTCQCCSIQYQHEGLAPEQTTSCNLREKWQSLIVPWRSGPCQQWRRLVPIGLVLSVYRVSLWTWDFGVNYEPFRIVWQARDLQKEDTRNILDEGNRVAFTQGFLSRQREEPHQISKRWILQSEELLKDALRLELLLGKNLPIENLKHFETLRVGRGTCNKLVKLLLFVLHTAAKPRLLQRSNLLLIPSQRTWIGFLRGRKPNFAQETPLSLAPSSPLRQNKR